MNQVEQNKENMKRVLSEPILQQLNEESPGILDWLEEILWSPELARKGYSFGKNNHIQIFVGLDTPDIVRIKKHGINLLIFRYMNDKWEIEYP